MNKKVRKIPKRVKWIDELLEFYDPNIIRWFFEDFQMEYLDDSGHSKLDDAVIVFTLKDDKTDKVHRRSFVLNDARELQLLDRAHHEANMSMDMQEEEVD